MTNYEFFIGIDVSKEWIDVAFSTSSQSSYLGRFDNNPDGFKKMLLKLARKTKAKKNVWLFCFENTGQYSKALLNFLYRKEIPRREEDPQIMALHLSMKRGKDDKSDALGICQYAFRYRDELEVSVPVDGKCLRIKRLLSRRSLLVKHKTAISCDYKENRWGFSDEELMIMEKSHKEMVALYDRQIKEVEQLIKNAMAEDAQMEKNDELIRSIKGIGPVISAYVIAITHNFQRFDGNARKFACYCGIAPFPNESGKSKGRNKISHRADKKMKSLLSNAAVAAVGFDKQTKIYFEKKRAEGKSYGIVINAVKNKLVARIFAVIKRQTPYVDLFAYK